MWLNAFRFSMQVLKKNHFKLMIPAFFLSLFMVFVHAAASYWSFVLIENYTQALWTDIYLTFVPFFLVFISTYVIYKTVYPLLRTYVLYVGWKAINGKTDAAYRDFRLTWKKEVIGGKIRAISMKRFRLQTISYALLFIVPLFILCIVSLCNLWTVKTVFINITDDLISAVCCIPAIIGFIRYFFAELKLIHNFSSVNSNSCTHKENFGKTSSKPHFSSKHLLIWKTILTLTYFGLVYALAILMMYCQFQGPEGYLHWKPMIEFMKHGFSNIASISFFLSLSSLFTPFFFQSSTSYNSYLGSIPSHNIPVQIFFIILLGLLTACFFLIETLSAVYFYWCRYEQNSSS